MKEFEQSWVAALLDESCNKKSWFKLSTSSCIEGLIIDEFHLVSG